MPRKSSAGAVDGAKQGGCCKVEAVVSVDNRGQMVLPKDVREKAGIRAGDKLAVVIWTSDAGASCVFLLKADGLAGLVQTLLGPLAGEAMKD